MMSTATHTKTARCIFCLAVALAMRGDGFALAGSAEVPVVFVQTDTGLHALHLPGEDPFHITSERVTNISHVAVPDTSIRLILWSQEDQYGHSTPYYAISLDGTTFSRITPTSYLIKLRHGDFDPTAGIPTVAPALLADADNRLFIVQYVTQPLAPFRASITRLGGRVHRYLGNHAHIVEMNADTVAKVQALPYVRWVGPYHPAYRLEAALREPLIAPPSPVAAGAAPRRVYIQVMERGLSQKISLADYVRSIGGQVDAMIPEGHLLEATLDRNQLAAVARRNEVLFIDRRQASQVYMDVARSIGGANYVEGVAGFTGTGVRAECMDTNLLTNHQDFQDRPAIIHGPTNGFPFHGTQVFGINFGSGSGNANARGMVPDAQGIFADFEFLDNRYQHTAELLAFPYYAVYQSNSWGTGVTFDYSNKSSEMDDILMQNDILILQAQANNGSQLSDEAAWAKNIVSVGGVEHNDTLSRDDDAWNSTGSIGPAADGRIKPDFCHFTDSILTTNESGGYDSDFGGTSGATPITAGHFGLLFQMWSEQVFENQVSGDTVFENRPHMSTAKALMINAANQYPFTGITHDLTRVHQGWGLANVQTLYDRRDGMVIVDETDVLANLEVTAYRVMVEPDEPALRATLVYTDPPGTPSSSRHRINDLTLRVESPSGTLYYGNNGLLDGNWSTPGQRANTVDTVENVFIDSPEPGIWTVTVSADEIVEDSHKETGADDADYALVISGSIPVPAPGDCNGDGNVDLDDFTVLADCLGGPDSTPTNDTCNCYDLTGDEAVDMMDVASFFSDFACIVPTFSDSPTRGLICLGERVVLSANADGNRPMTYQWLRDGIILPGAEAQQLVIQTFAEEDEGSYTVEVTNNCGMRIGPQRILSLCQ